MNKYRKTLKGTDIKMPTQYYVNNISQMLQDFNADAILFEYETVLDRRLIKNISFKLRVLENDMGYKLPIDWRKTAQVLKNQGIFKDEDRAYRIALYNIQEWLDAQLALLECQMVEIPQIFLPYMQNKDGETLYEVYKDKNFNIGMD